ncbi:3-deoxy-D-manno-octulosonic acid kinase [Vibrio rumoiensis]|uniref:3-deoxy-D-manno-octulosonic acid kinase n=1 Tax=Vibrio rumoiensis 1S-45 TaxID=1188252 RepID=A0A1E5E672_9VIBR|nr:3-deoxy-D-manno-octulosonic acid kinase [Vibrio rumoiensis]OEF29478.1 3-deoxy-D-manno-octulosonic acid kinase [Vibrio rumoiensis 1S-45]
MKTLKLHKQVIWYDDTLISQQIEQCLEAQYWQQQGKVIGSAQGRGTTWFVQTEKLPAALRHYRRGGLFGKLVKDHYWFSSWHNTRSFQEFQLLQHLIQSGVNVPKPIAARAMKRTFCYQADILTQKIDNAQDLVGILQKQPLEPEIYRLIGQQIRRLHEANVNHTDLNIHNILLDGNDCVWIIDFDKCHQEPARAEVTLSAWKQSNLDRLLRSFNKELNKRNIQWSQERDWQALLEGYRQHSMN